MTITEAPQTTIPAGADLDDPEAFVPWATALGIEAAAHSARHDLDGTFVDEAYERLRSSGYLTIAVPRELGGHGATITQVAMAQRALARHCASTALASSMHQHVVLFNAWGWRHGNPKPEAMLRRVVEDGLVVASTGGADLTRPRGSARKVDGGYRVSGRKIFASQSVVANVMSTMFPFDDPDEGRIVLNVAVPLSAEGVRVLDTWDALGMRGTASHDIELDDVFVPDAAVAARRPYGVIDPPLTVILSCALPVIAAVYLGVAESARDAAIDAIDGTSRADDPGIQRTVGLLQDRVRVASWALDGALRAIGDDPVPGSDTWLTVLTAKRTIADTTIEACDLAMEVAGGGAFYRGSPIERAYRDVRGIRFHPFSSEEILGRVGRHALGLPADER